MLGWDVISLKTFRFDSRSLVDLIVYLGFVIFTISRFFRHFDLGDSIIIDFLTTVLFLFMWIVAVMIFL